MCKKIISLLLSLLLLICIVGCGNNQNEAFQTNPNDFSFDFGDGGSGQTTDSTNEDSNSADNSNDATTPLKDSSSKKDTSSKGSSSGKDTSSKNNSSKDTTSVDVISSNGTSSSNTSSNSASSNTSSIVNCNHSYNAADCEQAETCKHCGKTKGNALGHKWVNGTCSVCKVKYVQWYTTGNVTITKSEVEQIINQQYKKPKNVIMMIGDGMGPMDIEMTEKKSSKCFDFGLILNKIKNTGYATTRSYDNTVTDSAASGTALATGHKTKNSYIGMSPKSEVLKNISEIAREKGKKIGIVTNDDVVGATPAAFGVHVDSRASTGYIAKSFVAFAPDVLIGQGRALFQGLNLNNFVNVDGFSKFNDILNTNISCSKPFFGFFEQNNSKDAEAVNTLAYCSEIAINRLKKNSPNGFFLMIENTTCDAAGHADDINAKMTGVITLDRALVPVLKFMKENSDTLLIITSDHDNGNIKLENGSYKITHVGHTGIDVRTFAIGYGAEYFNGKTVDNTDVAKFAIDAVLGK